MKSSSSAMDVVFGACLCIMTLSIPAQAQWSLVWQDEFDGTSLDNTKWTAVDNCGDKRNSEQQCYMASAISVANGALVVTATNTTQTGFAYTSGAVKTGTKYTVAYGKIEFRAQMPSGGQGVWPALWLYPPTQWPPEIDVLEAINTMSTIYMTYHWGTSSDHKSDGGNTTITNPGDWHLYAVEWEAGAVRWYIDGVLKKTHTGIDVTSIPMQVYINLALGGSWPGSVGTATVFPQVMKVDYVRVYKQATGNVLRSSSINRSRASRSFEAFTAKGRHVPSRALFSSGSRIVIVRGSKLATKVLLIE